MKLSSDRNAVGDYHSLLLTAHREGSRLDRLARLVGVLALGENDVLRKIGRLHDHKGDLHVVWFSEPSGMERESVEAAWSVFNEANVLHGVGKLDDDPYEACARAE